MSESAKLVRPDVESVLAGLKPFQRRSVDYVFDRLYGSDATPRFLLADEVGLGKTWVAKGVIARAIDRLWDERERIDVVYICSNHDIARQNIDRLNITGNKDFELASRITLLPLRDQESDADGRQLRKQKLNFVSFTPGTSFDLKSNMGVSTERVLLFHMLAKPWGFSGAAPLNVLQGGCTAENFRNQVARFDDHYTIDAEMQTLFLSEVAKNRALQTQFDSLCQHYHRADANVAPEVNQQRNNLIGSLREILARACLQALKPDLIILDEFQRFKHLLVDDPDSEASQLAHSLFRYSEEHNAARVLMLSATPYKMYTMAHESAEDDHYVDFLSTVRFLYGNAAKTTEMECLLKDYRRLLYQLGSKDIGEIMEVRDKLEQRLRSVMCRTERLAVTADRSGMLKEVASTARLESADMDSYLALQGIARTLDHHDTMEYWKLSPYLLSFMDDYALKRGLRELAGDSAVVSAFKAAQHRNGILLPWESLRSFGPILSGNPRLRELIRDTVDKGAWQTLWMPPSIPYYNMAGGFADLARAGFTKRLVFSSWQVVPKMIATLVSYEAERRMATSHDTSAQNTPEARKAMRRLLNFSSSKGRLTGMPVLGLMYPSFFLAQRFDPLRYMCEQPGSARLDATDVLGLVEMGISDAIGNLIKDAPDTGSEDEAWYWAAPILLDDMFESAASAAWWNDELLAERWLGQEDDLEAEADDQQEAGENAGWRKHVAEAAAMLSGGRKSLGRPPKDLAEVLALVAVAGPAVTALRAVARNIGGLPTATEPHLRHNAGRIAFGFRSLFNAPEVIALLRGQRGTEPYWRRVLEYCAAGCLQAVLDEYVHVLSESPGEANIDPVTLATKLADTVVAVLDMQSARPGVDQITVDPTGERLVFQNQRLRAWFAMRFGDEKDEVGKTVSRADQVRKAFNSPFWPFVLATTSVGQEGLDFHTYCHAVMHWNLPSNPVDMEQREGRVHRYKGHAVRRNVAQRHTSQLANKPDGDPWSRLFEVARAESKDTSGLTPFDGYVVRKDLVRRFARQYPVPTYVCEFLLGRYCASVNEEEIQEGLKIVERQLRDRAVRSGEEELFKSRAKESGSVKLIDIISARLDAKTDSYLATLPSLQLRDVSIESKLVQDNERMLTGGFYAEVDLTYDAVVAQEKNGRPFSIPALRPIQLSKRDVLTALNEGRKSYTTQQWKYFLLRSIGLEPTQLTERNIDVMLLRMVPFVENNYNLVELGPRGTGKSHLFQQISPYAHLVSGGKATVARMFVNMSSGQRGLVCQYDVVCFDEVSGVSFDQKDGVNIMKGYMESGEFSRGKESIRAYGGIVMVGNFDVDVQHQQRVGHLFGPMPPEMRNDTALMDRIHCFLPGWDVPKISESIKTDHFGLVSDFLSECWSRLRAQSRISELQGRVTFGGALSGRDQNAVNKTVSGLLKLMHPSPEDPVGGPDLEWAVRLALESRRRVKEQQKRIGTAEFRNTQFSYTIGNDGVEKFVVTPELQSEDHIGRDPLPAGQVWAIRPGSQDEGSGLFRIEVSEGPGSGVRILNRPAPPPFAESVKYAEQNLYARAGELVGDRNPREHEFSLQLRAYDASKGGQALGVGALMALCSALIGKSLRGGMAIVGGLNLGGSMDPVHNAVDVVELAVEKGASVVLMPVSARKQLNDLSDDMATKVSVLYYSDPREALVKAISD